MEDIEFSFIISKDMFTNLYRIHVKYKFKLHRSMIMSILLLLFGLIMQYIFKIDLAFVNKIVVWITFAAIVLNLLSDFVLTKIAYNQYVLNHLDQGSIMGDKDGFNIKLSDRTEKKTWNQFDSCIETEYAFLLYKKDVFTIVSKDNTYVDRMREVFKIHINNSEKITYRK